MRFLGVPPGPLFFVSAALVAALALLGPREADAQPKRPWPPPAPTTSAPEAPPPVAVVSAIPAAPKSPKPEDQKKAKAVFEAGGRAFDQGDFAAAIQAFEQAYTLSGRPSVLFSLAQAHRKRFAEIGAARHKDAAVEIYRAYLAEVKTGGRRADALAGIEALGGAGSGSAGAGASASGGADASTARKTQLAIDSPTPGAMISVDGGPAAPPQVMAEVTPGRHTVKITAPGHIDKEFVTQAVEGQISPETYELEEQPARIELEMPDGATVHVDGRDMGESTALALPAGGHFISIAMNGHISEARAVDLGRGATEKLSFDLATTTQRDASIGLMIAGAATAAGGGVLLGFAYFRQTDAEEIDELRRTNSITREQLFEYELASRERDQFRASGIVVGGAGGLAVLIGAALFALDSPAPMPPPAEGTKGTNRKRDGEKSREPSEVEELTFRPWVSPMPGAGVGAGGIWTTRF